MNVQLGQLMDNKIQEDRKNPNAPYEETGAKTGCWEQKQGLPIPPALNTTKGVGKPLWPNS